jgi:hypothetical protein
MPNMADQLEAARARIAALETRQQDHLALITKLTRETPYPAELDECRSARRALIAEVGTLRAAHAQTQQQLADCGFRIEALKLSIAEHADDVLGAHPAAAPAEHLALVAAHDLEQRQYVSHLEARLALLASLFGADPSQPTEDDFATIERGIARLTAEQPNWSHAEALKQRAALIAMDVENRATIRSLEAEIVAVRAANARHEAAFISGSAAQRMTWVETSASIAEWQTVTFGPATTTNKRVQYSEFMMRSAFLVARGCTKDIPRPNLSRAIRAAEELAELIELLVNDDSDPRACPEVADVQIVLAGIPAAHGQEQRDLVEAKMKVNRARRWMLTGDGHGQHVKEGL